MVILIAAHENRDMNWNRRDKPELIIGKKILKLTYLLFYFLDWTWEQMKKKKHVGENENLERTKIRRGRHWWWFCWLHNAISVNACVKEKKDKKKYKVCFIELVPSHYLAKLSIFDYFPLPFYFISSQIYFLIFLSPFCQW